MGFATPRAVNEELCHRPQRAVLQAIYSPGVIMLSGIGVMMGDSILIGTQNSNKRS
jgi:hypothetical protein